MTQANTILDANICSNCGGVWFSPQFESEGEPDVCPFCTKGMYRIPKTMDAGYDTDTKEPTQHMPEEIVSLMDQKTSNPLIPKACEFCTNFIFVAPEDVGSAKTCPYCSGKLVQIEKSQGTAVGNDMEPDDDSGEVTWSHVRITFKNERKGLFKLFSKPKPPISGICLGICPHTQRMRIMNVNKQYSSWHSIASIDTITEMPLNN